MSTLTDRARIAARRWARNRMRTPTLIEQLSYARGYVAGWRAARREAKR